MSVIKTPCLDKEQKLQVEALIKEVQVFDGTHRIPYLSNNLNFDQEMPAFFLAYEKNQLVGLLTVYADVPDEAELAIMVHPNYRRLGYVKELFHVFRETMQEYQLSFTVMSERAFLAKHPDVLANLGMTVEDDFEYWLSRQRKAYLLEKRDDLSVTKASREHLEAIADFQAKAFGEPHEVTLRYAKEALVDETGKLYIVMKDDEVVASCTVDFSTTYNYLYGLVVAEGYRGQGIGTYFMKVLVNSLLAENEKAFQIAVESDNLAAKRLYESLGFEEQTQVVYAKVTDASKLWEF